MKKLSLIVAAAAASIAVFAPAHAQELHVRVDYADLDISSAEGAATLAGRIEAGVAKACVRSADLRALKAVSHCQDTLLADAVEQLNGRDAGLVAANLSGQG